MNRPEKTTAAVIGGSMAGMLAARVLSERFDQVVLLDCDAFPADTAARPGVPQAKHLHALLPKGRTIIEQLFPGITDQWLAAGAELLDAAEDFAWRTPAGWALRYRSGLKILAASRPLIDKCVRERVAALPNVTFRQSSAVNGLIAPQDRRAVTGVIAFDGNTAQQVAIHADLVVDASGRTSRAPEWLAGLGYGTPAETIVNAHLGYASRIFRRNGEPRNWKAAYIQAAPPDQTRAGIAFPLEDGRWMVTLCGGGKDYAPVKDADFVEFARSLPSSEIYDLIRTSEPLTPIVGFRRMENRWRHFEWMQDWPQGFAVLGDAACAFNPVYGQGMTVAAIGAMTLKNCLEWQSDSNPGRSFQRALAKRLRTPWTLATGEDVRYRSAEGARPGAADRFMHWYVDQVVAASIVHPAVRSAFLSVFAMNSEPTVLFRPDITGRALAAALKSRKRPVQDSRRHAPGQSHAAHA